MATDRTAECVAAITAAVAALKPGDDFAVYVRLRGDGTENTIDEAALLAGVGMERTSFYSCAGVRILDLAAPDGAQRCRVFIWEQGAGVNWQHSASFDRFRRDTRGWPMCLLRWRA